MLLLYLDKETKLYLKHHHESLLFFVVYIFGKQEQLAACLAGYLQITVLKKKKKNMFQLNFMTMRVHTYDHR